MLGYKFYFIVYQFYKNIDAKLMLKKLSFPVAYMYISEV